MRSYLHAALVLSAHGREPMPFGPTPPRRRPPGGGLGWLGLFHAGLPRQARA
jgi:hypothetical protein